MFDSAEYRSALFERFVQVLERQGTGVRVLDLGSAAPGNLNFWAGRGFSYSVQDVVVRESRGDQLDFGAADLGGVLCWNVLSMLSPAQAAGVVEQAHQRLLPGGVLFAIFDGDGLAVPPMLRYRIHDATRLRLDTVDGSDAPRAVSTAEIERLLGSFTPTRVTVMRHGSREALGHVPPRSKPGV